MNLGHALLYGYSIWVGTELWGRYGGGGTTGTPRQWVARLKASRWRWPFKALIAGIGGIGLDWWVHSVALPTIQTGASGIVYTLFAILVSVGLGISIGEWLVNRDYQLVQT